MSGVGDPSKHQIRLLVLMRYAIYRMPMRSLFFLPFFLVYSTVFPAITRALPVQRPHVEVELVSEMEAFNSGATTWIGVRVKPAEDWHVYWKYAGDSGLAPSFTWQLPQGATVGEVAWPSPSRIPVSHLVNYGYGTEVLFAVPLRLLATHPWGASIEIGVIAEWLVCKEECIPGDAELSLRLPVSSEPPRPSEWHSLFEHTRTTVPDASDIVAKWKMTAELVDNHYTLEWRYPDDEPFQFERQPHFFPSRSRQIENAEQQHYSFDRSTRMGSLTLTPYRTSNTRVSELSGVLAPQGGFHAGLAAIEFTLPVKGAPRKEPAVSTSGEGAVTAVQNSAVDSVQPLSFLVSMSFAFLGGILLNLMPCVFPVLSIKAISLIDAASKDVRTVRLHGFLYSLGVVGSFLLLASALLVLRSQGSEFGWGFQLQSPPFVLALCFITFLIGLNLFGIFDIGGGVQRLASKASFREGGPSAFMSGVLATVLATPCTAPFMGSAIAAALVMPALEALGVFLGLGIGMALPFVLITWFPSLIRRLPRPGAWMETFRQLMAFPMFATVLWLSWVLSIQVGQEYLLTLFSSLLVLLGGAWVLGRFATPSRSTRERMLAQSLLVASIVIAAQIAMPPAGALMQAHEGSYVDHYGLSWHEFTATKVDELRATGVPVFVDFTAAWCITCQVNKRVVLAREDIRDLFREKRVALVRGDWTSRDARITEALERFGRGGVPLNVLWLPGKSEPVVFSSILQASDIVAALR